MVAFINSYSKDTILDKIAKSKKKYPVLASMDKKNKAGTCPTGSKSFFAFQSHRDFLDHILAKEPGMRNYYEIIDGSQRSCFYLDIDAKECEDPVLLLTTLQVNLKAFLESINLNGTILTLSASSEFKTSYHFIVRGDWVTEDHIVRGHLFSLFVTYLQERNVDDSVCDASVFSKWQNFRTVYSTKYGQDRPLIPMCSDLNPLDYFITYVSADLRVVTMDDLPKLQSIEVIINGKKKKLDDKIKNLPVTSLDKGLIKTLPNTFESLITEYVNDHSLEFLIKCIPNGGSGQPWLVWVGLGMALHRSLDVMIKIATQKGNDEEVSSLLDCGLKIYDEWSSASDKYDREMVMNAWESFEKNFREVGYNKGTLIRLAKKANPEIFKFEYATFDNLTPWEPYILNYNNRYVIPYDVETRFCFEQSPMGSGKTFQLAEFIKRTKPRRVVCLSPRQSYAANFTADMNEYLKDEEIQFVNYQDLVKKGIHSGWNSKTHLVIQMESIYKLGIGAFSSYDLMIVDEVESNLKTFSSFTMFTKIKSTPRANRLKRNLDLFYKLVTTSSKCIFADAFITNRTLNTINSISPFVIGNTQIRINHFQPPKKEAMSYPTFAEFQAAIIKRLEANERVIVFWGSKKKGKAFEQVLLRQFPNKKTKFYHADSSDDMDKDLTNVNVEWSNDVCCLMYSGKISVGVNFTVPKYFSEMFVYCYADGACPRDVMQATMRVRSTINHKLSYFADGRHLVKDRPTTIKCLLSQTQYNSQQLEFIEDVRERDHLSTYRWEVQPDISTNMITINNRDDQFNKLTWDAKLWLYNQLEDNLSSVKFKDALEYYFKLSGHELTEFEKEGPVEEGPHGENPSILYKDIPEIDMCHWMELKGRIERKDATALEKLMEKGRTACERRKRRKKRREEGEG